MTSEAVIKDSPVYLVAGGDFHLDAPVEVAWPCVIDFPTWQSFSTIERISGVIGEEDEVFLLRKDEEGFEFPPYYARTLKIEPESRIIWKTFPTDVAEGTGFFGIVEFRVEPAGDAQTRFSYDVLYEFNGPFASEAERQTFKQDQIANFGTLFASVFPKLEQLVADARKESAR